MNANPNRDGFALPAAVFALVVLGALMVGTFFIGRQEGMIGAASMSAADAFNLAERGASDVLATKTTGLASLAVWGTDTISDTLSNGYYTVEVTRTAERLFFLSSSGTVTKGGELRSGATRRVGVIASFSTVEIDPPAALTTRGTTTVRGSAQVIGFDSNPSGWDCPGTLDDMPGIVTDSGFVSTSGSGTITGNPATAIDPTVADSTFTQFGSVSWENLVAMANITLSGGNQNSPAPSLDADGECDLTDSYNWGDPLDPTAPCGNYFPVIYVNGDARMQGGGVGQGVLLVEDDLDLRGGFVFYGIVIVQGDFDSQGMGNTIYGSVMSKNADFDSQTVTGSSVVQYSSCSLDHALMNSSLARVRPIESRSWIDLSAVIG